MNFKSFLNSLFDTASKQPDSDDSVVNGKYLNKTRDYICQSKYSVKEGTQSVSKKPLEKKNETTPVAPLTAQPQQGRSMVEMLGVLAVIGVLSVASILGYRYAMTKYTANRIANELNLVSNEIMFALMRAHDNEFEITLPEPYNSGSLITNDYAFDFGCEDETGDIADVCDIDSDSFVEKIEGVSLDVCQQLVNMAPHLMHFNELRITHEDAEADDEEEGVIARCQETNTMWFYFGEGLNEGTEDRPIVTSPHGEDDATESTTTTTTREPETTTTTTTIGGKACEAGWVESYDRAENYCRTRGGMATLAYLGCELDPSIEQTGGPCENAKYIPGTYYIMGRVSPAMVVNEGYDPNCWEPYYAYGSSGMISHGGSLNTPLCVDDYNELVRVAESAVTTTTTVSGSTTTTVSDLTTTTTITTSACSGWGDRTKYNEGIAYCQDKGGLAMLSDLGCSVPVIDVTQRVCDFTIPLSKRYFVGGNPPARNGEICDAIYGYDGSVVQLSPAWNFEFLCKDDVRAHLGQQTK